MACTKAEKIKYRLLDNMKAALNGAGFFICAFIRNCENLPPALGIAVIPLRRSETMQIRV
jgi:hypothetical protein